MPHDPSRREFLHTAAATAVAGASIGVASTVAASAQSAGPGTSTGAVVIASGNGLAATQQAMDMIRAGADPLDAVVAGVNIVERDPKDGSVGYGGLPNEDGVVELDSCVMHGPTHNAGAVASLRNIKTPSSVAKLVMERTDHVLLVGEGALRFARAHGFKEEDLLTDKARQAWLKWKEARPGDDWLPPPMPPTAPPGDASSDAGHLFRDEWGILRTYGTINCDVVDFDGNIAGVTTTSGLSYKIPGRVGDSPIIGAGLYVDNEIGAAGGTGRGESAILNCAAFSVVERLREGLSPTDACLAVLKRVVDHNKDPRLHREDGKPKFNLTLYAVRKDRAYGSAQIWGGANFAVNTGDQSRHEACAFLYEQKKGD